MTTINITFEQEEPSRLDHYLAAHPVLIEKIPATSRAQVKRWVELGQVLINGAAAKKAGYELTHGDKIAISLDPASYGNLIAEKIPLEILYEDDSIIVINKPPNLVVHPGAGNKTGTLVNALLAHCKKLPQGLGEKNRPGIVHRLDKDTSGVVVVAKSALAHKNLVEQFNKRSVGRAYYALVFSTPRASREVSRDDIGVVDAPIGRHPAKRTMMAVVDSGRRAVTHWRVIERLNYGTLLEVRLETGRTHQIRVHMQHIGSPVIGDQVYGDFSGLPAALLRSTVAFGRQALHAYKLDIVHPVTGKEMSFTGEIPADFTKLLNEFGSKRENKN